MNTLPIEYDVNEAYIVKETDMYKDILLIPNDSDSYAIVMSGLKAHREIRLSIEEKRKENNSGANKYIKANNSRAKELHALNDPGEERLKDIRQVEDDRINEIKLEVQRIEKKRVDEILTTIEGIKSLAAGVDFLSAEELQSKLVSIEETISIDTGFYGEFSGQAAKAFEVSIESVGIAWANRTRLDKEDAERKLESERLEAIRFEQEEAQAKIDAERQAIANEKAELEATRIDAQERKDNEEIGSDVEDGQEVLKPDKAKLLEFADLVGDVPIPELKSVEADDILSRALINIATIIDMVRKETEAL